MVDGELKCIGSSQHLKTKLGQGFTIEARPAPGESDGLLAFLRTHLKGGQVLQSEGGQLRYQFTNERYTLSAIFALLEEARKQLSLESYSVGQTTLEQVFLRVRAQ